MLDVKAVVQKYLLKTFAVRFEPGSEGLGSYLVALHGPAVGLTDGIYLVGEQVLKVLKKEGVKFQAEKIHPGEISKVRQHLISKGWNLANPEVRNSHSARR